VDQDRDTVEATTVQPGKKRKPLLWLKKVDLMLPQNQTVTKKKSTPRNIKPYNKLLLRNKINNKPRKKAPIPHRTVIVIESHVFINSIKIYII